MSSVFNLQGDPTRPEGSCTDSYQTPSHSHPEDLLGGKEIQKVFSSSAGSAAQ